MACDLPRGERFKPSDLSLQSQIFPWKKSLCLALLPSQGLEGHSQHTQQHELAPQGPAYVTVPLLRTLEKAGSKAKAHGQAVVFSFQPPETRSLHIFFSAY